MWESLKLRLPEGPLFSESSENFLSTQTEVLQSDTLHQLALARLRNAVTNIIVPIAEDGQPLPVWVRVTGSAKSSVFTIEATSSKAAYSQAYLDALMQTFLEYKQNVRRLVSGATLASLSEQVQRAERDLKEANQTLMAFRQTNYLAILEQESAIAASYLSQLMTRLLDLELEEKVLAAASPEVDQGVSTGTEANVHLLAGTGNASSSVLGAMSGRLRALKEVRQDAERRQAIQLKIENVEDAIAKWRNKVEQANYKIAESEALKFTVGQQQAVYDRLLALLQNVSLSRNIEFEGLAILEPATPGKRSYAPAMRLLVISGAAGLVVGLGIVTLARFKSSRKTVG